MTLEELVADAITRWWAMMVDNWWWTFPILVVIASVSAWHEWKRPQ